MVGEKLKRSSVEALNRLRHVVDRSRHDALTLHRKLSRALSHAADAALVRGFFGSIPLVSDTEQRRERQHPAAKASSQQGQHQDRQILLCLRCFHEATVKMRPAFGKSFSLNSPTAPSVDETIRCQPKAGKVW